MARTMMTAKRQAAVEAAREASPPGDRASSIHKARAQRIAPFDKKAVAIDVAFNSIGCYLSSYEPGEQDAGEAEEQEPPAKRQRQSPFPSAADQELSQSRKSHNGARKASRSRAFPPSALPPHFVADKDWDKDEKPDEQAIQQIEESFRRAFINIAGSEGKPNFGVHVGLTIVPTHNMIAPERLAALKQGQEPQGIGRGEGGAHNMTPAERLCRDDGTLPVFGDDEATKDLWSVYLIAGEASSQLATAAAAGLPPATGTFAQSILDDDSMTNAVLANRYAAPHIAGGSNNVRGRAYPSLPSWARPMNSGILPEAGISVQHSGYMSSFIGKVELQTENKSRISARGRPDALQIFPLHLEHVLEGLEDGDDTLIEQARMNAQRYAKKTVKQVPQTATAPAEADTAPQFMGGPWTYLKAVHAKNRTAKMDQLALLEGENDVLELMDCLDWRTQWAVHLDNGNNNPPSSGASASAEKGEDERQRYQKPFLPGGVYCPYTVPQDTEKLREWEEDVLRKQKDLIGQGQLAHLSHPLGRFVRHPGSDGPLVWIPRKEMPLPVGGVVRRPEPDGSLVWLPRHLMPQSPLFGEDEGDSSEMKGGEDHGNGQDGETMEAGGEEAPADELNDVSMLSNSNILEGDITASATAAALAEDPPLRSTPIAATRRASTAKSASHLSGRRQQENVPTSASQSTKTRGPRFSSHQPGEVLRNSRRGSNRSSLPADAQGLNAEGAPAASAASSHSSGFLSSLFPRKKMTRATLRKLP